MKKLIINGAAPLYGSVRVGGSKNAALPILFASLVTEGVSEIEGFPDIGDTRVTLEILKSFGVKTEISRGRLLLDTRSLVYRIPDGSLVRQIRASTYLIGASLARFGECRLMDFGGCNFSKRPIDLHIYAATAFGATCLGSALYADRLTGASIALPKPSVGATVNALIMASAAEGVTHITGYAKEPHVLLLADYLRSAGADITVTDNELTVVGSRLHGGKIAIIGDMIEAGTYLTAGLITDGEVEVIGVLGESMEPYISLVSQMGAEVTLTDGGIRAGSKRRLDYAELTAGPYPGFPTDLQPIVAPLFARFSGGRITDTVFPDRFGYLDMLSSFGVLSEREGSGVKIKSSELCSASVTAPCLRGGAACMLAALSAKGESSVRSAELILRGYEDPVGKLTSLGADIRIV